MTQNKLNKGQIAIVIIMTSFAVTLLGFIITMLILGDPTNRLLSCLLTFFLYLVPVILILILKNKISSALIVIYFAFVTIGAFCGSCLNLTKALQGFDKVQHTLWGYISCFIGLFYLCKTKEIDSLKKSTIILVFLGLSLATAGLWEVMEFAGDRLLNQTAQGNPINGIVAVDDAMFDIICHTCGSVVFMIQYLIESIAQKRFIISRVIEDFKK